MASSQKVSLVSYRRNSSDMDLSTSDEDVETDNRLGNHISDGTVVDRSSFTDNETNGDQRGKTKYTDEDNVDDKKETGKSYQVAREERLHEKDRRDSKCHDSRRERRSPDSSKKDRRSETEKRRDDSESKRNYRGKDRSITPERRRRKSRDRSRGRSPNHHHHFRSRSPVRSKHSPERRDHRKRSHSPDRRSHKFRRGSRSPEISFRSKRLEKKAARIDRLGLELIAEPKRGVRPFLDACTKDGEASTGGFVPSYFNPGATNPSRIAEQIQKRRLLWGSNKKEPAAEQPPEQAGSSGTVKTWEAATFKGDNDGKMTEKFKRLMGIKGEASASGAPADTGESIIQKQEEMFSNMEAQYQVARMATHTHRGIGLGFGTFQVPPR